MTHKLMAKYDEKLSRKVWVVACGISLEGAKITDEWRSVKCKSCREHKPVRPKRINIQELLAGVGK